MMKPLLVTSALPCANGPINIGHLVECVQADIWVRFWRLRGRDAIYLCADDAHGADIMVRARDEGTCPEHLIARAWQEHRRDFAGFQIHFDNYYTTHSDENRDLSRDIYECLRAARHISEHPVEQAYCVADRMFLPDRDVLGKCPNCGAEEQFGDSCEVCSNAYAARELIDPHCARCGAAPTWRPSMHMFFSLGDRADQLRKWVKGHVAEEIGSKLEELFQAGPKDWAISRDAPYFGFEIPERPGQYFYVWLDAPIGYIASTMDYCRRTGRDFDSYWRRPDTEVVQFMGKDIACFHALLWPALLMDAGYRTPSRLMVHGSLTVNGEKTSKGRGTLINAATYLAHLDPQYLRYYYASKITAGLAGLDLNFDGFVKQVNADLVHKIANIPSRVLSILHQHFNGRLGFVDEQGRSLIAQLRQQSETVSQFYEQGDFAQVTRQLTGMAVTINGYLQEHKAWATAKEGPSRAATVCTSALNAFKILATLLTPILPEFGQMVARTLGVGELTWAGLDEVLEDRPVLTYQRLVECVERSKVDAMLVDSRRSGGGAESVTIPKLTLDPLVDCDLRVMKVEAIATVPGAKRLVNLTLQIEDEKRQVLLGLGENQGQRNLTGQNVLVLTNLEPKTTGGVESRGLILAAEQADMVEPVRFADGYVNAVME